MTRADRTAWTLPPLELLLLPALVVVLVGVLTPSSELFPNQFDVYLYFQKAEAFAQGALPYTQFELEYPPLALVPMVVPYLASPGSPPTFEAFQWLFLVWQAVLLVGLVIALTGIAQRLSPTNRDGTAIRLVVLTIVAAPSLAWRFDLFPALLSAVALLAALNGRAATAGVAIALGVLAKLYPAVLVPVLVLPWLLERDWRRVGRFALAGLATFTLVVVPVYGLVGDAIWSPITYQNQRGLQVETLGGGLLLLRALLTEQPARLTFDFGAVHVAGPLAERILAIQLPVLIAALGGIALLALRRFRAEVARLGAIQPASLVMAVAATIGALLVTNKVFSVQYVVWLLPFAALLSRRQFWLFVLIAGLSIGIHPLFYDLLIRQLPQPIVLLNVRNALVVVLAVWCVAGLWQNLGTERGVVEER